MKGNSKKKLKGYAGMAIIGDNAVGVINLMYN